MSAETMGHPDRKGSTVLGYGVKTQLDSVSLSYQAIYIFLFSRNSATRGVAVINLLGFSSTSQQEELKKCHSCDQLW